ncbi:MAG TPA: protein kinase [Coleofasciculaceae cyanobacterium]
MNAIACTSCGKENPSSARFCSRCGVPMPKPNPIPVSGDLPSGIRLRDRYIIMRPLGRGGMGRTYLAEDTGRFNEWVVLKELTPIIQGTQALQKAEELFQREAAILHRLSSPQIPRFWEFFREGRRLFLVQDYIEGKTYQSLLEERIALGQYFSEAEIIELFQQLLPVLSYLHSLGIIHRDIAPDNIICRALDRLPVLIDLGGVTQIPLEVVQTVPSSLDAAPSSTTTRLGKLGYAPDEQLRLGIVAPHSDLYALGVTALVLMTGKQPQQLIDPKTLKWVWQQQLALSPHLSQLLSRMLASQPSERFQTAEEILQQLATAHSGNWAATQMSNTVAFTAQPAYSQSAPVNPISANNSGQGQLFSPSLEVPEEIRGWNWGAFFFPGIWCIPNRVWIGLVAWTDLSVITLPITLGMTWPAIAILLGVKGNEWAWKSRRWKSIRAFKRHQRFWAIAGFFLVAVFLLLVALIVLKIFGFW